MNSKRLFLFCLGTLCACFFWGGLLPGVAQSRSFEVVQHRDWASWIESSPRDIRASSATIINSGRQRILLQVDYQPEACGVGTAFMIIPMSGYTDAPFSSDGAIRVDRNTVIQARFTIAPHPEGIHITINDEANQRLLRDAREGGTVRIKIDTTDREPLVLRFSLAGFTAAAARSEALCDKIEQALRDEDDSSFFNDTKPQGPDAAPRTPRSKKSPDAAPDAGAGAGPDAVPDAGPGARPSQVPDEVMTL